MYQFFVEPEQIEEENHKISIIGGDFNHIANVLRMKEGEEIMVCAQDGVEYHCRIASFADQQVLVDILDVGESQQELPSKIYLFQGLPKSDKMELIIQKAVELGVFEIIPVETSRVVVRLDHKKEEAKRKRWQGISESAAKQSKRGRIPQIQPLIKFSKAVEKAKELDIRLIPYELAEDMEHTRNILSSIEPGNTIGIFIGPEGGFSEEEITLAKDSGMETITLGKRILRTETAGMSVLSVLGYLLEGKKRG